MKEFLSLWSNKQYFILKPPTTTWPDPNQTVPISTLPSYPHITHNSNLDIILVVTVITVSVASSFLFFNLINFYKNLFD